MKANRLERVMTFINTYYCEKITLDDLEEVSKINRFNLVKEFKKTFGTTPHNFILQKRVHRAKELMSEESSFALIAQMCGFSDQSHMIKQFKKVFGYTPTKAI